ncbi:hypothetical protein [Halorhabdus sp. SVX81]|uniref:hypothetical protein n=1 Tax=Halorhabdus sp. SVX81 TaxID=2978283 RepID=UPI0023DCC523|nr:hypothetical protein [Halorhabdus sp. SVX81]
MGRNYKRNEVFTPNSYPKYTYVEQEGKDLEEKLNKALETHGEVISLAGPSKSGKTVLIENVVDENLLIKVLGSTIDSKVTFWKNVLDEMGVAHSLEETHESTEEHKLSTRVLAKLGLSSFIGAEAETSAEHTHIDSLGETEVYDRVGISKTIEELQNGDYLLLIDDFHYIDKSVQEDLAEVIKEIPHQGISIGVALVPHRSEDILRGNPDLRGRVQPLDIGYWDIGDLKRIAEKGFRKLNVDVDDVLNTKLAEEAAGSPQLMQRLCLEACYVYDVIDSHNSTNIIRAESDKIENIYKRTVGYTSHERTVDILDSGKESRGEGRTVWKFRDGSEGDYYNCILRAIGSNPVQRSFNAKELKERMDSICIGDPPATNQIKSGCGHMDDLCEDKLPNEWPLDWDRQKEELHIPDPYFLFYLRWSDHIGQLPTITV